MMKQKTLFDENMEMDSVLDYSVEIRWISLDWLNFILIQVSIRLLYERITAAVISCFVKFLSFLL